MKFTAADLDVKSRVGDADFDIWMQRNLEIIQAVIETAVQIADVPTLPHGVVGDAAGQIAYDASYFYVCIADYVDDATVSWKRVAITAINATSW